ncbi:hypothetical protein AB1N83_012971 [Pleurotus pulmonarius]
MATFSSSTAIQAGYVLTGHTARTMESRDHPRGALRLHMHLPLHLSSSGFAIPRVSAATAKARGDGLSLDGFCATLCQVNGEDQIHLPYLMTSTSTKTVMHLISRDTHYTLVTSVTCNSSPEDEIVKARLCEYQLLGYALISNMPFVLVYGTIIPLALICTPPTQNNPHEILHLES